MTKRQIVSFILIIVISIIFIGCEDIATLLHGPKPAVICHVTFEANGANGTPPEALTVNEGSIISLPNKGDMVKGENIFAGWNERSNGTGITYSIGASVAVISDMVFYAQWLDGSTPQYTVTFSANGATSGAAPEPQTVYSGISITVPGQGTLAYTGKKFGGWNTQANGGGTNYASGATFTVMDNVTLYAKWQSEVQYTVTYNANGASGTAPTAQTVDPGTEITLQGISDMVYTGKKFTGWATNTGGTGTIYTIGSHYTVTGNVTFYAQWQSPFTVTYNANGANGDAPDAQTVDPGTVIVLPGEGTMTYSGKVFDGWNTLANGEGTSYAEGVSYTVNANITLYAKWINIPIDVPGATLADKLSWINSNAASNKNYIITLDYDEGIGPSTLSYSNRSNITIRIRNTVMRTINLSSNGILFTIGSGVTLILDSNVTLKGRNDNTNSLVKVNSGGTLIMNTGSKITGNIMPSSSSSYSASGAVVVSGGTFTMNGGEISGNTSAAFAYVYGGGVCMNSGTFTMNGGEIFGNTVYYVSDSSSYNAYGGGVYVGGGIFTKNSGTIYGKNGDDKSNMVKYRSGTLLNNRGQAIYADSSPAKKMENTVGPEVYLFFNYNNGSPIWSGGWE